MFRQKLVSGALAAALALSPALAFGQDQTSNQGSLAKTGAGGVANLAQMPEDMREDATNMNSRIVAAGGLAREIVVGMFHDQCLLEFLETFFVLTEFIKRESKTVSRLQRLG